MRVSLAQQAQELLGKNDVVIITERVDDVALLIGQMVTMGFVEVLDRPMPRHWKQRRVSWGWTAGIWLASFPMRFHPATRRDGVISVFRGFSGDELRGICAAAGVHAAVKRHLGWSLTAAWRPQEAGA